MPSVPPCCQARERSSALTGLLPLVLIVGIATWLTKPAVGADIDQPRKLLLSGQYDECIKLTSAAIQQRVFGEEWYLYKADAEMQLGKYKDAFETISGGLTRYGWSIRMRQAGI